MKNNLLWVDICDGENASWQERADFSVNVSKVTWFELRLCFFWMLIAAGEWDLCYIQEKMFNTLN